MIARLVDSYLNRYLHWVYLVIAVPSVIHMAQVVPPLRVPDEQWHVIRTAHVAEGGLVESRNRDSVGAYIDAGFFDFEQLINRHNPKQVPFLEWEYASGMQWRHEDVWMDMLATQQYGPLLYFPQAVGLLIGRVTNLTVLHSFELARIVNGIASVLICCFAIALCDRGKLFIFVIASLPMAVFLMASVSQDAGIIAISLLVAGLISRSATATRSNFILLAAAVAVLSLARPSLLSLGLLLWLPMWRRRRISLRLQLALSVLVALACFGWTGLTRLLQGPLLAGPAAAPTAQIAYLRSHPLVLVSAPLATIFSDCEAWGRMFVGQLGWLDVVLPDAVLATGGIAITLAAVACLFERSQHTWSDHMLTLLTLSGSLIGIMLLLYLVWTPAGDSKVVGFQGRYLYSVVPLLVAAFPYVPMRAMAASLLRVTATLFCVVALSWMLVRSMQQLRQHYWATFGGKEDVTGLYSSQRSGAATATPCCRLFPYIEQGYTDQNDCDCADLQETELLA